MEWISVEDEMPTEGRYIFATRTVGVKEGFLFRHASKYKNPEALINGSGRQFTHWMPLPAPPQPA